MKRLNPILLVIFSHLLILGCVDSKKPRLFTCNDKYSVQDSVDIVELVRFGYDELSGLRVPNSKMVNLKGEYINLHELSKGFEGVIIDFWFIGCAPCEAEMPYLIELKKSYDNVKFISIARNSKEELNEYLESNKEFDLDLYLADNVIEDLCIDAFPTLFVLDKNFEIQNMYIGGSLEPTQIAKHMDQVAYQIDEIIK